jgi:type 1 fimbriae regulatory protein FimB/type 1 fimbriae regulatory protein FimE
MLQPSAGPRGRSDFLSRAELRRLFDAARAGRHAERDLLLVMMAYRHGLRASELVGVRRSDLDLDARRLSVRRLKHGRATVHSISDEEDGALRAWLKVRGDSDPDLLFLGERGPLSRQAVNYLFREIGERAGLGARVTPRLLRHSCGHHLAQSGSAPRDIQLHMGHTSLSPARRYTSTGRTSRRLSAVGPEMPPQRAAPGSKR